MKIMWVHSVYFFSINTHTHTQNVWFRGGIVWAHVLGSVDFVPWGVALTEWEQTELPRTQGLQPEPPVAQV